MGVQWTDEQLEAIERRGSNILVAAAAGSGKTAVLVERIIRKICDPIQPVSVDRLLVLTFTEAAASEMKRKIAAAISKKRQEEPENRRLFEQSVLVHSAHISTVHAFCKNMLQNFIHKTDLPIDFTMLSEVESSILRQEALDEVLERYYRRIDQKDGFRALTVYGGTKSDDHLRSVILHLHDYVRSLADPKAWLYRAAKEYQTAAKEKTLHGTVWEELLLTLGCELVLDMYDGLLRIWHIVDQKVPSDHKYYAYYQELLAQFERAYAPILSHDADFQDLVRGAQTFEVPRTPVKTGLEEETVAQINGIKEQLFQTARKELNALLSAAEPKQLERICALKDRVMTLKQLVRQTDRLYTQKKRAQSGLDFSDLEHEMIRLITDAKGRPNEVARALQARFEEILVDEYQDTNDIQDTIFRLLSRENTNIFMVGDLKQSIYRFRNADPTIFAEKYESYRRGEGGICIRLFKNFRSRRTVVNSVNSIFASIMTKQTGGIDYTEDEYLISGAVYAENAGDFTTEVLLTDTAEAQDADQAEELTSTAAEAVRIAKRIRRMIDTQELMITDTESGEQRPIRGGDICILVRNKTHVAELEQTLAQYGIASLSEVGQKYLDSIEVLTVLHFLQVIDNPRQDIPLLAVLRSPIFGFSPDELAEIRLCDDRKGCYYDALCAAKEQGNPRAAEFLKILKDLRDMAVYSGVDVLILKICHELHYMAMVGAMPNGRVRQANLNLLYAHAAAFEQGSMHGLFRFMVYIESLRSQNQDMKAAAAFADTENTVPIMTIHKSKGLEYPVVILCGMDRQFHERDMSAPIIWHKDAGLAMDYIDTEQRVRYGTLTKQLVRARMMRDARAEEMRLFYVAATRAREKLILSAPIGTFYDAWKKIPPMDGEKPSAGILRRQKSMRDWLLTALLSHPDATVLREIADWPSVLPPSSMTDTIKVTLQGESDEIPRRSTDESADTIREVQESAETIETERFSYQYPYIGLSETPVKLSVSELKRRTMPDTEYVPSVLPHRLPMVTEYTSLGAAERGTIVHYVMQHIDFGRVSTVSEVDEQLEQMVKTGLICEKQRRVVSAEKIWSFFESELGRRLTSATHHEREFDFYMEVPAKAVTTGLNADEAEEAVLLQGIADCFFYEEDGVVLIDYKTDAIRPDEAEERAKFYQTQIEYYTEGLQSVLECPIKERYLYFLHCGCAVAV